jgi:hypothetical protein
MCFRPGPLAGELKRRVNLARVEQCCRTGTLHVPSGRASNEIIDRAAEPAIELVAAYSERGELRPVPALRTEFVCGSQLESELVQPVAFLERENVRMLPEAPGQDACPRTWAADDEYGFWWRPKAQARLDLSHRSTRSVHIQRSIHRLGPSAPVGGSKCKRQQRMPRELEEIIAPNLLPGGLILGKRVPTSGAEFRHPCVRERDVRV